MLNRVRFFETKNWTNGKGASYVTSYSSKATPFSIAVGESHSVWYSEIEYYMSRCFSTNSSGSFEFAQVD